MNAAGDLLVALAGGLIANVLSYIVLGNFDKPTILRVTNGSAELKDTRVRLQPNVEASDEGLIMKGSELELIRHERPALRYGQSVAIAAAVFAILLIALVAA